MTHFPQITELPEAIFWDWDGTIVDSYAFLNNTHNITLRALGMPDLEEGAFRNFFGKERLYIFSAIYGDKEEKAKEMFQRHVMENNHLIKPMEGVEEVLDFLHNKGVGLGVVTNKRLSYVEKELSHTGLKKYISIVVGAKQASEDKPSAAPLIMAADKMGLNLDNQEIWYAGDTETDLICAQNAGCKSVFFEGHIETERLLLEYAPYISFDNYSAFKDFLVAF